ncbi:hypothetical protein LJK88_41795 [Paenibacillus sp. P26]|nr:hypothetical protein LJK88_41795 [Paenibacillus sp. P26]
MIGVFNAGVMHYGDEVLLLLRVAERPVNPDPNFGLSPFFDLASSTMGINRVEKGMPGYNFSDSRGIGTPDGPSADVDLLLKNCEEQGRGAFYDRRSAGTVPGKPI